ncbi:DUF1572 family protein [Ignavibacteria bacterium]|nr:DUF1572 family protein [Bacteroidota bacterium]MCZ2132989.1 DUF1572 domain-containing protein [Bacteroidota bacterium]
MSIELHIIKTLMFEFHALKRSAELALAQVSDEDFFRNLNAESNSLAIIVQHISGNLHSRFTDFLTSDGEKPDRDRDAEFEMSGLPREDIMKKWERNWQILFDVLDSLPGEDLQRNVTIRGESFGAFQAFARQLSHYGNHCGQIIYAAKLLAGENWRTLTIPRGQSKSWKPAENTEQSYFRR